jgi:hypothetical protein
MHILIAQMVQDVRGALIVTSNVIKPTHNTGARHAPLVVDALDQWIVLPSVRMLHIGTEYAILVVDVLETLIALIIVMMPLTDIRPALMAVGVLEVMTALLNAKAAAQNTMHALMQVVLVAQDLLIVVIIRVRVG